MTVPVRVFVDGNRPDHAKGATRQGHRRTSASGVAHLDISRWPKNQRWTPNVVVKTGGATRDLYRTITRRSTCSERAREIRRLAPIRSCLSGFRQERKNSENRSIPT